MKLALLHNRLSGLHARQTQQVLAVAAANGIPARAFQDFADLEPALRQLAELEPEALVINGGDGTIVAVVTLLRRQEIFRKEPALVLLRGGTTNMIARDVGLAGTPARGLRRLLAALRGAAPGARRERRWPLSVQDEAEGGAPAHHGFFFGGGALPRVLHQARRTLHPRGLHGRRSELLMFAAAAWRMMAGRVRGDPLLDPGAFAWRSGEGRAADGDAVLFVATTLQRLVLGINPALADRRLRLLALRGTGPRLAWPMVRLLAGRPAEGLGACFDAESAEHFELRFAGEWALDGETSGAGAAERTVRLGVGAPLTFLLA